MFRRRISSGNLGLRSLNHRSSKISLRLFHESTNPVSTTQNHSNLINQLYSQDFIDFTTFEYQTLIPKMAILVFLGIISPWPTTSSPWQRTSSAWIYPLLILQPATTFQKVEWYSGSITEKRDQPGSQSYRRWRKELARRWMFSTTSN